MVTRKPKGIHTSPENAGPQNLEKIIDTIAVVENPNIMTTIMEAKRHGDIKPYTGKWTDDELLDSVNEFFAFCESKNFKPTKPLLRVWLRVSQSQMNDWFNNKDGRYRGKSVIVRYAYDLMECYLQADIDKNPKGSMFLLKTSFGHIDSSKLDITTNGVPAITESTVVQDLQRLGLDVAEQKTNDDDE